MHCRVLITLALLGCILFAQFDAKAIKHKKHKKTHIKHKKADGKFISINTICFPFFCYVHIWKLSYFSSKFSRFIKILFV